MEIQLFSFFCVIPAIAIFTKFIFILIVVNLLLVKQTYLPTQHLTLNLTLNQNSGYGPFHRKTLPTSLLHKRRGLQLRFSRGANLDRSLRFYRSQILLWSTTLLNERLSRTFSGGCSLRAILAKHVPSFAPGTASPFSFGYYHWKEIFLGRIIGSPPVGMILTCLLLFLILLLNSCYVCL